MQKGLHIRLQLIEERSHKWRLIGRNLVWERSKIAFTKVCDAKICLERSWFQRSGHSSSETQNTRKKDMVTLVSIKSPTIFLTQKSHLYCHKICLGNLDLWKPHICGWDRRLSNSASWHKPRFQVLRLMRFGPKILEAYILGVSVMTSLRTVKLGPKVETFELPKHTVAPWK